MNQIVMSAIRTKRKLRILQQNTTRIVEPHVYGLDDFDNEVLICYGINSGSPLTDKLGWSLIKLNDVKTIFLTENSFDHPRAGYQRSDNSLRAVIEQL